MSDINSYVLSQLPETHEVTQFMPCFLCIITTMNNSSIMFTHTPMLSLHVINYGPLLMISS